MARVLVFFCFFSLSCICSHARLPPSPRSSNATADELALLSFKSMISSRLLDSWNTSSHYCSWPGVACGRRHPHRVISLHMGSFNLSGHISPFLGNLSFLRELDLRDNQLIGQLAKATDGFTSTNLIGSGSFGSVYKGVIDDQAEESTNLVAVKVLKVHTPGALKSFIAECEALRNVRHRNLVKIITACSSNDNKGNDFKAIVFDFMPNGSLDVWLHPYTNEQTECMYLDLLQRVTILLDVAYALDYLHCQGPAPVVHCDLKPSNVLLDADMVAHVGDFGLARILVDESSLCQHSTSSMGLRGTIGYAAPEYGAGNMVSTHGDIYSFGILVLETITAKRPTDSRFGQGLGLCEYVELALHNNSVMGVVDSRLPLDLKSDHQTVDYHSNKRNVDCLVSVLRLGISCSQESPSSRMPTRGIIKELKAIKESLSTQ
ncbi:receptor kinase-like protein Xa21 isoform X2 [Triticum urartu]|uniref:receptor kinase-like protein Xa21 isoform X2 n=1 Tax=Triticum urartu TaxID=4572 RepID=UPI002044952D|nr:receptor kinase-like protein Xa21 isoform X2 [Triticum urartu]